MSLQESAKKTIYNLAKQLSDYGYTISNIELKQYNFELTVENLPNKLKVQTYFGKKGVKTIIQGNKSTSLYESVSSIIFGDSLFVAEPTLKDEPTAYIGSDESGKGDFFGPLVIAAVYLDENSIAELKRIGVKDSKQISDQQISILAGKIYRTPNIKYSVKNIIPEVYNKLYSQYLNLNKLLDWAHSEAIGDILKCSDVKDVITDKFSNSNLSIERSFSDVQFTQVTKGERYTAVAAASIIARDTFNKWFEDNENNGISLLKGASNLVEQRGREIFSLFGKNEFDKLCKKHFKTYNKIIDN